MTSSLSNYAIEDILYNVNDNSYEVDVRFDAPLKDDKNVIQTIMDIVSELNGEVMQAKYKHRNLEALCFDQAPCDKDIVNYDFELCTRFYSKDNKDFFKYLVEDLFETIIGLNEALEVEDENTKSKSKIQK